MKYTVIFITASHEDEAKKIGKTIVEQKIAACVNIVPRIHSIYWWKGKIDESSETLLIVKTVKDNTDKVIELVKQLHSYEVPEVIAIDIAKGNPSYLSWIKDSVACIKPSIKKQ